MARVIPNHKKVLFKQGGRVIPDFNGVDFIFDDDLEFAFQSEFGAIVESKPTTLLTLLSNSVQIAGLTVPSGQFALQSMQVWQTTEPLEFDLGLKMFINERDGFYDIVKPAMILAKFMLPAKTTNGKGQPGQGLIPPGPNLQDILKAAGLADNTAIQAALNNSVISSNKSRAYGGVLDIEIGGYWVFNNCILTAVKPTFSEAKETKYGPVSAEITITIRTSEVATTNMVDNILTAII